MLAFGSAAADDVRRVVFHLDEADPARQNLVLNNASNVNFVIGTLSAAGRDRR